MLRIQLWVHYMYSAHSYTKISSGSLGKPCGKIMLHISSMPVAKYQLKQAFEDISLPPWPGIASLLRVLPQRLLESTLLPYPL